MEKGKTKFCGLTIRKRLHFGHLFTSNLLCTLSLYDGEIEEPASLEYNLFWRSLHITVRLKIRKNGQVGLVYDF